MNQHQKRALTCYLTELRDHPLINLLSILSETVEVVATLSSMDQSILPRLQPTEALVVFIHQVMEMTSPKPV